MNNYEINLAIRALQSYELELSGDWEKAQKSRPYGSRATGMLEELKQVRLLSAKLDQMHRTAARSIE